jgi:formylglycine-generating enzyme required for sulfatase activity
MTRKWGAHGCSIAESPADSDPRRGRRNKIGGDAAIVRLSSNQRGTLSGGGCRYKSGISDSIVENLTCCRPKTWNIPGSRRPRSIWDTTMRLASIIAAIVLAPMLGIMPGHAQTPVGSRAEERALKPKDTFRECNHCPEMMVVPAGSFAMGSPAGEERGYNFEGPQHQVKFARPFAVGMFAITFEEWDTCVADGGCNHYAPNDEGWGRGRRPVINVSWDDAKAYVAWLSRKTGKTYRLLSEAEREYMTRAGTTTPFWWGPSISPQQANFYGHYFDGTSWKGEFHTEPVDSFQPNPWGLYQVHGNVSEWTEDCYNNNYWGAPSDGSAWISGDCSRRVVRGGGWYDTPENLRAAARFRYTTVVRDSLIGFRVGRTLPVDAYRPTAELTGLGACAMAREDRPDDKEGQREIG